MANKVRGLYQRPDSDTWWITYTTADGRRVRESTKTADRDTAKRILDDKRGRLARGEVILPRVDKVTYDAARDDLRAYYQTHKTRDLAEADARLKHLDALFSGRRLATIGQDTVTAYAAQRQAVKKGADGAELPGAANGTINREQATLSKMLRLAYEHGKLQRLPVVKKLREAFDLKRHQYNAQDGTLRLDPGTTKNREGRVVRLTPELRPCSTPRQRRCASWSGRPSA